MSNYRTSVYFRNPDGTHRRITLRAETRRELEAKKRELKEKEMKGIDLANDSSFGHWAEQWLNNAKLGQGLSKGTEDCYKAAVHMLTREFGNVQFRDLTMDNFQKFINRIARANPNTHRPTSARYLRLIRSTAKDIALYASGSHVDGANNAFFNVSIPRAAPTKKVVALTERQISMIESFPHEMQVFAMIATFGGLRRGEVLALQWKHIDLKHSLIHVEQSLNWCPNQPVIKEGGKTVNSYRTVAIPPVLVSFLRGYRDGLSVYPAPQAYVCANAEGKPYTQQEFRRRWESYNSALNRKYGNFGAGVDVDEIPDSKLPVKVSPIYTHQCRHTFATLCYLQGLSIPDTMQELGHAQPTVTLAIYTDLRSYHKFDLSAEFKKKLSTSYRIPLNGDESNSKVDVIS